MGNDLDQIVNDYATVYRKLKKKLRWHFADEKSLMMVSSLYITKEEKFEFEEFYDLSEYIKKNVGLFSTLKSSHRFITAAMLDVNFLNSKEKFHEYLDVYEKLINGGFKRGNFTYMAALCLLLVDSEEGSHDLFINRAMAIYKAMKKDHFFLTGESDYPLTMLLAQLDRDVDEMMDEIDYYYKSLHSHGFRKGNDLQFLSHILSLHQEVESDVLVNRASQLANDFKKLGRKVKPIYYPAIGLLSLLESGSTEVNDVMTLLDRLNSEKGFRWHKDINFIMAVNFIAKDQMENTSLVTTGIQITIETIIQAQQAAMLAAMSGAVVASTSSSGSST